MTTPSKQMSEMDSLDGASIASADRVLLVDVSDTSQAATGTNKAPTISQLAVGLATAGSYATTANVSSAVSVHVSASDPHGDRAYTDSLIGSPTYLRTWRAAVARVRANAGDANVVFLGDSTTVGAGGSSLLTSSPARFVEILNGVGIASSYCSAPGTSAGMADSRVSLGTGWSIDIGATHAGVAGGRGYKASSGAAGSFSFTPPHAFDSFIIRSVDTAGIGTVTVNVDGGGAITPSVATSGGYTRSTYSCSAGTHTINVTGPSGGPFYLRQIDVSSSTASRVRVHNLGYSGSKAADFLTSPTFSDTTLIKALYPDLFVVNLIVNDSNAGTNVAAYTASLTSIVNIVQGYSIYDSSVLMVIGAGSQPQPTDYASYVAAVYSLGFPVVDLSTRWGTYADASSTQRAMMADSLHPNNTGYYEQASAVVDALRVV